MRPKRSVAFALVRACHPEPTAVVTIGASVLAAAVGRDAEGILIATAAVGTSQLAVGWHNDWVDVDRDTAVGRTDKPAVRGEVSRRALATASALATVAALAFGFLSGVAAGLVAAIGVAAGLAYNWPLKSTPLSVLPYIVGFMALPAFMVLGLPGTPPPPAWLLAAGGALGAGAHFANVLRDLDEDRRTGVRGLPHRVGRRAATILAMLLLVVAGTVMTFGPGLSPPPIVVAGWLGSIVAVIVGMKLQRRYPTSRAAFRTVMIVAIVEVLLLLAASRTLAR